MSVNVEDATIDNRIQRLPEEIESEIRGYLLTKYIRLQLLLQTYPLDNIEQLLNKFSREQLDKIYRYGCVDKVFEWDNGYEMHGSRLEIKRLFERDIYVPTGQNIGHYYDHFTLFVYGLSPLSRFNDYWRTGEKKHRIYRPEYIRRIKTFCQIISVFPTRYSHSKLRPFSEKFIYDLIMVILIQQYPPVTQENYGSFSPIIPVTQNSNKPKDNQRTGGGAGQLSRSDNNRGSPREAGDLGEPGFPAILIMSK